MSKRTKRAAQPRPVNRVSRRTRGDRVERLIEWLHDQIELANNLSRVACMKGYTAEKALCILPVLEIALRQHAHYLTQIENLALLMREPG